MSIIKAGITTVLISAALILIAQSCRTGNKSLETIPGYEVDFAVTADYETNPVKTGDDQDAADDPAIWVNEDDPANSIIVGTDKKSGLYTYNLHGGELSFLPVGLVNNVDLRPGYKHNNEEIVLVGASNRTDNSLSLVKLNPDGSMVSVLKESVISTSNDEVYGFCMYRSFKNGKFYAFMNSKDGLIEQFEIRETESGEIEPLLVRTLNVPNQPEGMVAYDEQGLLFVGEEGCCIHKFKAEPGETSTGETIAGSGSDNPDIVFDIEGLSLYRKENGEGYLIASIQGSSAFGIFDIEPPYSYIGNFSIAEGRKIDGVSETDGIESVNYNLGPSFRQGILIVQDGLNTDQSDTLSQNFKIIDWAKIEKGIRKIQAKGK